MALTGLTWSFEWYKDGFYHLFTSSNTASSQKKNTKVIENRDDATLYYVWNMAYDNILNQYDSFTQLTISDSSIKVKLAGCGNNSATDDYYFDSYTGELTPIQLYKDSSAWSKLRGWIYSVHVGSFGGLVTRICWFLVALLGATLPLTGYYLWIKRSLLNRK